VTFKPNRILLLLAIVPIMNVTARAQDQFETGTVNIILANPNGIVVVTDSMETGDGPPNNAQKLMRLDDQSVVTLAGFAGAHGFLRLDVMGILAEFKDQLATNGGNPSFDEKLKAISFLIGRYMAAFVNAREVVQPGQQPAPFRVHIFIAGFDTDGIAKIGSLWLRVRPVTLDDRGIAWQVDGEPQVSPVGSPLQDCKLIANSMEYCVAGFYDVTNKIMDNSRNYAGSPGINPLLRAIAGSKTPMKLIDLEALAKFLSKRTHIQHPDKVGGPDQVAVFKARTIAKLEVPLFPPPSKPIPFILIIDVHSLRFGPGGGIGAEPGTAIVWIRDTIWGYQQLVLDGNLFIGNEIRDSYVVYGGGSTFFDRSNKVANSTLHLYSLGSDREFLRSLTHDFEWSECVPFGCDIELPKN